MAQSRRGFRGSSLIRAPKRQVSWGVGPNASDILANTTQSQVWTNGVQLVAESEVTIVRIRGSLQLIQTSQTAVGDGVNGAIGIGLASAPAFAAGIGSLPTPLAEEDWQGWMWHQYFQMRAITATESDGSNAQAVNLRMDIDSKAMRKFGTETVLFGAIEFVLSGGAAWEFNARTRILAKLS